MTVGIHEEPHTSMTTLVSSIPVVAFVSILPMFRGCYVNVVVMVADVASGALVLLVTKLADISVFFLVAIVTKDINVHWLLSLSEHTSSVSVCGYFLF